MKPVYLFKIPQFILILLIGFWAEGQAFCSPVTDLLARMISKHPLPSSRPLSSFEWGTWVDPIVLELEGVASKPERSEFSGSNHELREFGSEIIHDVRVQISLLRDLDSPSAPGDRSQSEALKWLEASFPGVFKKEEFTKKEEVTAQAVSAAMSECSVLAQGVADESTSEFLSCLERHGIKVKLILGRTLTGSYDRESNSLLPVDERTQWVVGDLLTEKDQLGSHPIAIHIDFNSLQSMRRLHAGVLSEVYFDWSTSKYISDLRIFLIQMKRLLVPGGSLYLPIGEGSLLSYDLSRGSQGSVWVESPGSLLSFSPSMGLFPKAIALNAQRVNEVSPDELQDLILDKKREWLKRVGDGALSLGYSSAEYHHSELYPLKSAHFLKESKGCFQSHFVHLKK